DSQVSETQHNAEAFYDLRKNLKNNGLELGKMPLVIQFNKRDLEDIRTDDELAELAERGEEPVYLAVATKGTGVVETFMGLLHLTWRMLDRTHDLSRKLSIDGEALLGSAAQQLGVTASIPELLARRVGGKFERTTP